MSAVTVRCVSPGSAEWFEKVLLSVMEQSETLTFVQPEPGLFCVVAVSQELATVLESVKGRRCVHIVDSESGWSEMP